MEPSYQVVFDRLSKKMRRWQAKATSILCLPATR
jgi:hypothetical protein